jgi:hypothetical protein
VKLLARLEANVSPWLGERPIRDIKPRSISDSLPHMRITFLPFLSEGGDYRETSESSQTLLVLLS